MPRGAQPGERRGGRAKGTRLLAHAIKAPATESCAAPGTNAKERLKELVRAASAADEITLKAENAAENASAAEPAAESENTQRAADLSAPVAADGVLCTCVVCGCTK